MWLFRAWKTAPPVLALSQDFYGLRAIDIMGKERPMSDFKGQVLLISNVASKCGLTQQHIDEFKQLKEKFGPEGFEVLGFPTRQFNKQEEIEASDIAAKYQSMGVNFPIFQLTNANGADAHPVLQYCKMHSDELYDNGKLTAIGWNFGKFLLDRDGLVYKYYGPKTPPSEMEGDIGKLLRGEAHGKKRSEAGD